MTATVSSTHLDVYKRQSHSISSCTRDRTGRPEHTKFVALTYRFSSAMPLRVLLPRFVKETNAAPRLLATVAAAMIRCV